MLTRSELLALLATCEVRHGADHPLTRRIEQEWRAAPPEETEEDDAHAR